MSIAAQPNAECASGGSPEGDYTNAVVLSGRYRIFPGAPIAQLDSPSARAFAARDDLDATASLYALVCAGPAPPRLAAMRQLKGMFDAGQLRLVDYGRCLWPPLRRHVITVLFERPGGERLRSGQGLPSGEIIRCVVVPVAASLERLSGRGLTHRAVRPDNLFWTDSRRQSVMLGECVTSPPGHDQPILYETVENALACPAGRSAGTAKHDLFALGTTILALCCRQPIPVEEDPCRSAVRRLEQGSAAVLIGDAVPPELRPLLRGLLCDDPEQRWGFKELAAWLRSERVLQRPAAPTLAFRPFRLGNGQHRTVRSLAVGLASNVPAAAAAIRSGQVEQWVQDSARDEKTAEAINGMRRAFSRFARPPRRSDEALVARASMLLDPDGPLRFGGFTAMPEGLGPAAYTLAASAQPPNDLIAILEAEIPSYLPAARVQGLPGFQTWIDRMRSYVAEPGLGSGIERCLYEMNPNLPCLGEIMGAACAVNLETLAAALEENAKSADFETSPIDAHIAGFAAAHLAARRAPLAASSLRNPGRGGRPLLELRLLAAVQAAVGDPPMPLLGRWMAHRVAPLIAGLRNRTMRKRLAAELDRRKETGRLSDILGLVENARVWQDDERGFSAARERFRRNRLTLERLRASRPDLLAGARERGQRAAAATALALGAGLAMVALLTQLG